MVKTIEDITFLSDAEIQRVLLKVEMDDLVVALKGVNACYVSCLYRNMSPREVTETKRRIESIGPMKLERVEESHRKIVGIANSIGL